MTPAKAVEIQQQLRGAVVQRDETGPIRSIGGADVAFDPSHGVAVAAVTVFSYPGLEFRECATTRIPSGFPYLPGLLSFREAPAILEAVARLRQTPDLLLCDGHGYAHPRRFGVASHIGVLTGLATIGVAKTILIGRHGSLPWERGAWSQLEDAGEVVGAAVRTREGVKPVYVSIGNRVSLETAIGYVLRCSRYRLPEPSRWAHHLAGKRADCGCGICRAARSLSRFTGEISVN